MSEKNTSRIEEKLISPASGFMVLAVSTLLFFASLAGIILAAVRLEESPASAWPIALIIVCGLYATLIYPILTAGLKVIKPNEAAVYTLFGNYYGTIAKPGFFWIHPFCSMVNASVAAPTSGAMPEKPAMGKVTFAQAIQTGQTALKQKVSLKAMTLNNSRQKINDREGNPIDIGVVVIWRVVNATKAVFEVDNYKDYVSIQADAAIRHVARQYPYDVSEEGEETSLRGSSTQVAEELMRELQERVSFAGIEILDTRIAHLAYAQEIAAAMLQRQQAGAVIAARQKIVDGAVGMVEMALDKLAQNKVVILDEERKAAMVSNLLVVLCGNKEAQPIVNSGSIY
ncbi:MAG: SPFH domain-containing protein [Oscillospiraceae bacterium]|jgi:regulator of protease activity HflC (stomatin/prohibitin superfamily)|nr:SPFH domain-containing protein [Oscillospiraceae bacterium]